MSRIETFQQHHNLSLERKTLPFKDKAIWAAETAALAIAVMAAQRLGVFEAQTNILQSLTHLGVVSEIVKGVQSGHIQVEGLNIAAAGVGLITGIVLDLTMSAETLTRLTGKIRLTGTGNYVMAEDGVRERNRVCVDARIEKSEQHSVEPGAGLMGGAFVNSTITSMLIHQFGGDNIVANFFSGYFAGRTLPTALASAGITQFSALRTGFESWIQGKNPVREKQLSHDHACGWSGTENFTKHWLKFSHHAHKTKAQILDNWNKLDAFSQKIIWEPAMNTIATLISGFSYIIHPTTETTQIQESSNS